MSTHTTSGRRYVPGQTVANSARRLNETVDKLSRTERDQRTFSNAVKRKVGGGGPSFPRPVVITNCTTGTPGVVKIKLSTGPGSTTAKDGAPEENAWLGTDAFSSTGMALWADRINEKVGTLTVKWLIRDAIIGAAHWTAPTAGELATTQDNPTAATLCDG
jgi:hypothetical protein